MWVDILVSWESKSGLFGSFFGMYWIDTLGYLCEIPREGQSSEICIQNKAICLSYRGFTTDSGTYGSRRGIASNPYVNEPGFTLVLQSTINFLVDLSDAFVRLSSTCRVATELCSK